MIERIIAVIQELARLILQNESKAMRANFQQIVRRNKNALTNTLSIEEYPIKALTVGKIDTALVPGQFGMVTRCHFVIEPDLVCFVAPNGDNHAFECEALPLETATTIL